MSRLSAAPSSASHGCAASCTSTAAAAASVRGWLSPRSRVCGRDASRGGGGSAPPLGVSAHFAPPPPSPPAPFPPPPPEVERVFMEWPDHKLLKWALKTVAPLAALPELAKGATPEAARARMRARHAVEKQASDRALVAAEAQRERSREACWVAHMREVIVPARARAAFVVPHRRQAAAPLPRTRACSPRSQGGGRRKGRAPFRGG